MCLLERFAYGLWRFRSTFLSTETKPRCGAKAFMAMPYPPLAICFVGHSFLFSYSNNSSPSLIDFTSRKFDKVPSTVVGLASITVLFFVSRFMTLIP